MSGLVNFDRAGALGPALTLLFNVNRYNAQGLDELTKIVKENFKKLANQKPSGRKEFCSNVLKHKAAKEPMLPLEVVHNTFFSSMRYQETPPPHHERVVNIAVPKILEVAKEQIPNIAMDACNREEVTEWLAGFLESYMTPEQLDSYINTVQ